MNWNLPDSSIMNEVREYILGDQWGVRLEAEKQLLKEARKKR